VKYYESAEQQNKARRKALLIYRVIMLAVHFCYIRRVMLLFAFHSTDHRLAFLAYAQGFGDFL